MHVVFRQCRTIGLFSATAGPLVYIGNSFQ